MLSISDKAILYRELAKLVGADFHLDRAVTLMLGQNPPAARRDFLTGLERGLARGAGIASALEVENASLAGGLERSLVKAGEQSGRLGESFAHLAKYFAALAAGAKQARGAILYPLVLAHLGILLPELPQALSSGDWSAAIPRVLVLIGVLWLVLFLFWWAWKNLTESASRSAVADRWLGRIPLLGKVRQHWALARFSQVSHAGLLAAMRLSEVTRMAGEASQSGRLLHAAQTAAPRIESGERLAESLRTTQTFPRTFVDGIATAEEAGTLDQEMQRWADLETEEATEATARAAEWLPRLFYALVALYIIYRIVTMFFGIYGEAFKMLDG